MFDRCLYFNVNALARVVNKQWTKAFEKFDLSPAHGYLLRAVLTNPGISQKQLADELRLEKSTITRFVEALEQKGLVERWKNSNDARETGVYATKQAKTIQAGLESLGDELYQTMVESLGANNLKQLVKQLRESATKLD